MTPEEEQALHDYTQAIAKILYKNTRPEQLKTLGKIEQAVRKQMQKHVLPEVGGFLSQRLPEQQQGAHAPLKVSSQNCG